MPKKNASSLYRSAYIGQAQNLDLYGVCISKTRKDILIDREGNEYIDMLSAASSQTLGYGRHDIVRVYAKQCVQVPHTCTPYTFVPVVAEYARALSHSSTIPGAKVLFGVSGSDAVEGAVKCAQVFTRKNTIISFSDAYHSGTITGLAVTGFKNLAQGITLPKKISRHLPYPAMGQARATYAMIERMLSRGDIAALIMEPIMGDGGVIEPEPWFMSAVKTVLHKHGALLIADEIQSGVCRTGKMWAFQHYKVVPDMICSGKGLGAGYVALSACIGRPEIIDSLKTCQHVFTYAGHAASCAVGLHILKTLRDEQILAHVKKINQLVLKEFRPLAHSRYVREIRGRGLMLGIVLDGQQKSIGPAIGRVCLQHGVYVGYFGKNNNVLRIQPALTMNPSTAIRAARKIVASIAAFEKNPSAAIAQWKKSASISWVPSDVE